MVEKNPLQNEFSLKNLFSPLTIVKAIHWLVIIGLILFFNGTFNNFVADDPPEITQNPVIQSIQNLPQFFEGSLFYMGPGQKLGGSFYRPLQSVFFSSIYTLFGPNYFVFHLFQLFLFIVNACILFLLFKQFFTKPLSFILALVFLIHPINSETAYYISATQEVLFLFFGLLSLWIVKNYQSQKALFLAGIFLFCSILAKETGVLFFLIIPLYLFLYHRKRLYPLLGYALLFFCLYLVLRLSAVGFAPAVTKNAPIQELSLTGRLINMPEIFLFYIKTFFFPIDLASVYDWVYKQIDFQHFYLPLIIDVLFIGILSVFAAILQKKSHKQFVVYIFFFVWFLIGMFLHMQLIPLDQTVADQWFYFPVIGLLGMIGVLIETCKVNLKNPVVLCVITLIISFLAVRTFVRSFDWRDDFTLASHDIQISKDAYPLEHELSHEYNDRGEYQLAKLHAERSIQLFPYVFNYTDLGNADFSLGQYAQAKKAYLQALHYGDNYTTYDNLAALYIDSGDPKEGVTFIQKLLKTKYPTDARLWLYLAVLEYRLGNKVEAKTAIQYAYQFNTGISEIVPIYTIIMNNQHLNYKIGK